MRRPVYLVKMLEKSKNFKKSQKIFKTFCSQKCQKSRLSDPMGVCNHLGGQWGPLDAILNLFGKNIFFDFFSIFRLFGWLRWFANFRFRARRPPQSSRKVPNPLLFEFPDIWRTSRNSSLPPTVPYSVCSGLKLEEYRTPSKVLFWGLLLGSKTGFF